MTSQPRPERRRWRYGKQFDEIDGLVLRVYRWRLDVPQVLRGHQWTNVDPEPWRDVSESPNFAWMGADETKNLLAFLRTGNPKIPGSFDLGPPERYQRWECPICLIYTIVPVVIGLPNPEDMEAAMRGEIILQGCIVHGDEPARPIVCTQCGWFGEHIRGRRIRQLPPSTAFAGEDRQWS